MAFWVNEYGWPKIFIDLEKVAEVSLSGPRISIRLVGEDDWFDIDPKHSALAEAYFGIELDSEEEIDGA